MSVPEADASGAARRGAAQGWTTAALRAVVMLVAVLLAFAVVPTWFLDHVADRLTTTGRDLLLVAWWMVALVVCSWLFVRLQRRPAS